jgi:hypothetical protein
MYCIQMDFDFENHITLWSIRSRFYHWTTGFPIPSPVSMTPAKERVGHRRAGSHPALLEQLLWEHRCSWDIDLVLLFELRILELTKHG